NGRRLHFRCCDLPEVDVAASYLDFLRGGLRLALGETGFLGHARGDANQKRSSDYGNNNAKPSPADFSHLPPSATRRCAPANYDCLEITSWPPHRATARRHDRQIELCLRHGEIVIERERACGLEICDRRDG